MPPFARILLLLLVVPAVYFFVFWVPFSLIPLHGQYWIANLVSLLCAAQASRFIWTRSAVSPTGRGPLAAMGRGALAVGGIGFCAGFFGPLLFTPEANQGPLLGLFITGPLGFLLGGVGGFVYWLWHRDKPAP